MEKDSILINIVKYYIQMEMKEKIYMIINLFNEIINLMSNV